ncbi:MAG: hypothetical protein ACE5MI_07690 [Acidimicrobiia bacterium]
MFSKVLPVAVVLAVLVGACGEDLPNVASDGDQAILRVEHVGGFAPVESILAQGPSFVLAGDRQLISLGPQIEIFPGPLLPNYQTTPLTDEELNQVLAAVVATGLPEIDRKLDDSAASFVADATTTVVTFADENGEHVFAVYALGIGEFEDPQVQELAALIDLLSQLAVSGSIAYQTDRVQVIATEGRPQQPEFDVVKAWPVNTTPDEFDEIHQGFGCMSFDGPQGLSLLAVFMESHELTYFAVNGTTYRVLARQLLPGEEGCTLTEF